MKDEVKAVVKMMKSGKQNKKQTASDVKILRKHTEQKSSTPKLQQDMKVMIGLMMAVVLCVYISLFIWLYK
ncbi:uncharacterized protein LOC143018591 isoform X2 [Oratosquilla oratoria]|uniref:uncharacterized protein LOC143018591 isoform X2 n=1 Tax=Oratosquilla oratoria TaxID=337810 RepID=UPI003F7684E3